MFKLPRYIDKVCLAIVVLIPILSVTYLFMNWWGILQIAIPFPVSIQIMNELPLVLVIGFMISFVALFSLGQAVPFPLKWIHRTTFLVISTVVSIPMCCMMGFAELSPNLLIGSGKMEGNHYYVTVQTEWGDIWVPHYLSKCNDKDFNCQILFEDIFGGENIYPTSFINDPHSHEIHLFLGHRLEFTDGPYPHSYEEIDGIITDNAIYGLYTYNNNKFIIFVITKCDAMYPITPKPTCTIVPFRYSRSAFNNAELLKGQENQTIKLLVDGSLILSIDSTPHCYAKGCELIAE